MKIHSFSCEVNTDSRLCFSSSFFFLSFFLSPQVFPRLNAWGEPRRIRFLYCDLRWGIPNDATLDMAIRLCLEEIDECKAAHTQP